jgi:hypothetical protein
MHTTRADQHNSGGSSRIPPWPPPAPPCCSPCCWPSGWCSSCAPPARTAPPPWRCAAPEPALEVLSPAQRLAGAAGLAAGDHRPRAPQPALPRSGGSSPLLAVLLSLLGGLGAGCLGLVWHQLLPLLGWWPLLLDLPGPLAGLLYRRRAARDETVELRLISHDQATGSALKLRAHRDELIALELELGPPAGALQRRQPAQLAHLSSLSGRPWPAPSAAHDAARAVH